jgi:hypothetical protein
MPTPAATLPAPPPELRTWSLMTLAAHLCVTPSTAYVALCPFIRTHGVGPTFGARRSGHHFELRSDDDTSGVSVTDCHLSDAAVAHLVAAFPEAAEARRIVAAGPLWPGEQAHRIATFLVEHHGGAA